MEVRITPSDATSILRNSFLNLHITITAPHGAASAQRLRAKAMRLRLIVRRLQKQLHLLLLRRHAAPHVRVQLTVRNEVIDLGDFVCVPIFGKVIGVARVYAPHSYSTSTIEVGRGLSGPSQPHPDDLEL